MPKPPEGIPLVDGNLHAWNTKGPTPIVLGVMEKRIDIPFPIRDLRRRAAGWPWDPIGKGWKRLQADRVHVESDLPVDLMRGTASYIEDFYDMMRETIGGPDAPGPYAAVPFTLRVFADRGGFCKFAACIGAANAESLYYPMSKEMAVWFTPGMEPAWLQRILAHEFAHAYMDRVWGSTSPLWFAEGMAEFFSNFIWIDGAIRPGGLNDRALRILRTPIPLETMFDMGRGAIYGGGWAALYAQAWTFVHYLFSKRPEAIRELLEGGVMPLNPEVHAEWKEHVAEMKSAVS